MESWQPGKSLQNGRFIIEKVLGGGGFGITYSIREQRGGNLFVLKTLNNYQQSRADFQQRQVQFVNEALRLAKCIHPHIVRVHEVIQESELWGMVMEHIDGDDLEVYVMERGFFPGYLPRDFQGIDYFSEVLLNDPIPIRHRDASISPRLAEVIDLGLIEKPEIYFKSAGDFKQALLGTVC